MAAVLISALVVATWERWTGSTLIVASRRQFPREAKASRPRLHSPCPRRLPSRSQSSHPVALAPGLALQPPTKEEMSEGDRGLPSPPPPTSLAAAAPATAVDDFPGVAEPSEQRFKVRDENGQPVVARLHGRWEDKTVLILPDGQLGLPNMLIPTVRAVSPSHRGRAITKTPARPSGQLSGLPDVSLPDFLQVEPGFRGGQRPAARRPVRRLLDAFRKNHSARP